MKHPNVLNERTEYGVGYWQWANKPNTRVLSDEHVVGGAQDNIGHVFVGVVRHAVVLSASAEHDAPSCTISPQDALTLAAALVHAAGIASGFDSQ